MMMQPLSLQTLPTDVINYIFAHLSIPESAATRQLSIFFKKLDRKVESEERFLNMTVEDFTFISKKGEKNWDAFLKVYKSSSLFPLILKVYLSFGYLWVHPPKDIIHAIEHLKIFIDHYFVFKVLSSTVSHPRKEEIKEFVSLRALAWKNKFNIPSEDWMDKGSPIHLFETVWQQTKNPLHGTYLGIAQVYAQNLEKVVPGVKQLQAMAPHCSLAKFVLGRLYSEGKRVERDLAQTVNWWRSAADQGDAEAQYALGKHYESEKNQPEALHWFHLAANQNYPSAFNDLGFAFLRGNGVKKDASEAFRYFRRGAEKGCSFAQWNLGIMYFQGWDGKRYFLDASHWLFFSARQGFSTSQIFLAHMYVNEYGGEKNLKEAVKWYRKAAEQNSSLAKLCLGILLQPSPEADQFFVEGRDTLDVEARNFLIDDTSDLTKQIRKKLR